MELDIFLPKENLAFEYQGEQHFYDVYSMAPLWVYRSRDEDKRMACSEHGVTLVDIPYWWDKEKSSLVATIRQHRPELLQGEREGTPISMDPPTHRSSTGKVTGFVYANSSIRCSHVIRCIISKCIKLYIKSLHKAECDRLCKFVPSSKRLTAVYNTCLH